VTEQATVANDIAMRMSQLAEMVALDD
jgi:hypothetical protein